MVNFQDNLLVVLDRAVQFESELSAVGAIAGGLSVNLEHKGSGALFKCNGANKLASVGGVGLDVAGAVVGVGDSQHAGLSLFSAQEGGHLGAALALGLRVSVVIADAHVVNAGAVHLKGIPSVTLL